MKTLIHFTLLSLLLPELMLQQIVVLFVLEEHPVQVQAPAGVRVGAQAGPRVGAGAGAMSPCIGSGRWSARTPDFSGFYLAVVLVRVEELRRRGQQQQNEAQQCKRTWQQRSQPPKRQALAARNGLRPCVSHI